MKRVGGIALCAVVVCGVSTADAQLRGTSTSRVRMVLAHCTTGPCDPFFTFSSGSTLIKRVKQPKLVSNRRLGKISISSLQRLGAPPLPPTLDARLSGTIFYGSDANAACAFANTTTSGPFATSTMNCVPSAAGDANCSGNLFFINFTPAECSDVSMVIQDLDIEVFEGGFAGVPERKIGSGGMSVLGKSPDCASGGVGCP